MKTIEKQRFERAKNDKLHGYPKTFKDLRGTKVLCLRQGGDRAGPRGAHCPGCLQTIQKPLENQRFRAPATHAHHVSRWPVAANHMVSKKPWKSLGISRFWDLAAPQITTNACQK